MKIYEILTRVFLDNSEMDNTITFYENLLREKCKLRFKYPEKELELASVGSFLLISGSADHLKPFTDTRVTFLVDSVADFEKFLQKKGAIILECPKPVPTGRNMRAKHPDGLVVEYVEYDTEDNA